MTLRVSPEDESTGSGAALFASTDYVGWYRELFELMRSGEKCNLLFDSTILEPTDLLFADARRALQGDQSRFRSTFGWGSPLLIAAIARRYGVEEKAILTTTGCTSALSHVFSTYLERGAHVVIEAPHFELLPRLARNRGAVLGFIERERTSYGIDPERLAALLRANTRLIVLTNAHNPSGAFLDDAALLDIAAVVRGRGIPVLVDEVYGDFVPRSRRSGPAACLDPCFISVNSLTKVYGLHALKCGWIVAAEDELRKIRPVYSELETGSSKITHGIASLILDELPRYEAYWRHVIERNRPLMLEVSEQLRAEHLIEGEVGEFGCMYFPRLSHVRDTRHFAAWMWDRARIGIAPGDFFGAPGHIRIGFGQPFEELRAGLEQFADGLRAYPG